MVVYNVSIFLQMGSVQLQSIHPFLKLIVFHTPFTLSMDTTIHLLQWLHSATFNNLRFSSIYQREFLFFGCYYFGYSDTIHIYSYKAFFSLQISISQSPPSFFFLPSYLVGTTYVISASHSKKFSSLIGPAIIPSGGFRVSSETCTK